MRLDNTAYTVFDVETTGLFPYAGDRICEIGAVRIDPDGTEKTFQALINPLRTISPAAFAVNGITEEMLKGQPTIRQVLPDFMRFIKDSVLVAYNAGFDLGFIESALGSRAKLLDGFKVVDALKLARKIFPGLPRYSLANVACTLGFDTDGNHRALADAIMTKKIFKRTLDILRDMDISTIEEIAEPPREKALRGEMAEEDVLAALEDAIANKEYLRITYKSVWSNRVTERLIKPKEIKRGYDRHYVVAYCHLRKGDRNFRIDSIMNISGKER